MKPSDVMPVPSDWDSPTVRDAIDIRRGISWSKDQEHTEPREDTYPVIRISNVQDRLELDDLLHLSGLRPKQIELRRVERDWCLLVASNGNRSRIGNAVFIEEDSGFLFASFLNAAKPKTGSNILPGYFYRWLMSEPVQALLGATAEGSTGLSNLSLSFFEAMRIGVPRTADEQGAIVGVLDTVDAALKATRTTSEEAGRVLNALSQRMFEKGLRNEQLVKTRIGWMPKSWTVRSVSEVTTALEYGLSVAMQAEGKLPILRMGNIQEGAVEMKDLKYVTLPASITDSYLLKRGDVLFNRVNSQEHVGKVAIFRSDVPCVFASYLIRVVPDEEQIDGWFLGNLLNSYSAQCRIRRYATPGVQQVNINASNLGKVLIPVPSGPDGLAEQREIATILEQARATMEARVPVLRGLEALKRSLQHDLLTGTRKVTLPKVKA